MTILYKVHNNLYVNLTNKCPCSCTFCLRQTMDHVTEWYYGYVNGADMLQITDEQIEKYTKAM